MKKNLNKLATLALTGILMTGMSFGALADGNDSASLDTDGKVGQADGKTSLTFVKEVEVKDVDDTDKSKAVSAPDISFDYAVTAGTAATGTKTKDGKTYTYKINEGVVVRDSNNEITAPSVGRADFDTRSAVTEVTGKGYCVTSKDVTVDFSKIKFTDAGVYRYVITETAKNYGSTNHIGDGFEYSSSVSENTQTKRAVDVFVSRQTDGTYKITGYEMYLMTGDSVDTDKTQGYTIVDKDGKHNVTGGNVYSTYDMTVQKLVDGSLAQAKYDFTVQFDRIPSGAKYLYTNTSSTADLVEGPGDFGGFTDKSVASFKFANKGIIKIQGIPYEATATVNETDYSSAGYVTTGKVDNGAETARSENGWSVGNNNKTDGTVNAEATALVVTNTLEEIPVTGVVMNIAPYAAMILGAGAFAGVFLGKRKSEDEE